MLLLVTVLANAYGAPTATATPGTAAAEPAESSVWDAVPEPGATAASPTPPMPTADPELAAALAAAAEKAKAKEEAAKARAARKEKAAAMPVAAAPSPAPKPVVAAAPAPKPVAQAPAAQAPAAQAPAAQASGAKTTTAKGSAGKRSATASAPPVVVPADARPGVLDRLARVAAEKGHDPLVVRAGYPAAEAPVGDRPQRAKQAPDPYSSLDFTAYTLEPGEVRVGLGSVSVGLYGRVQVGTSALLDALRVVNVNFKVDALRAGPVDVALYGAGYNFFGEDLTARYGRLGAHTSVRLSRAVSVHGGAAWSGSYMNGTPNLDPLAPVFSVVAGWTPSSDTIDATEGRLEVQGTGGFLSTRVAADVRFNRRDSIVVQGEAVVYGRSNYPVEIPASLTGGAPVAAFAEGPVPITEAYVASIAWQASFRNADLRIGIGTSSIPGAWLLQSTELAFRFGGPSRKSERLRMAAWRSHQGDAVADDADAPGGGATTTVRPASTGVRSDVGGGTR